MNEKHIYIWSFIVAICYLQRKQQKNAHTYFDLTILWVLEWHKPKVTLIITYLSMPTLEEVEVPMDKEELFLSQIWEKLYSPDCSLFQNYSICWVM